MLVFHNPGTIDPRLISTFGANVKSGESPIGYFGTGLKYAIARTVKAGGSICILSGGVEYTFRSSPAEIKGKTLDFIEMVTVRPIGEPGESHTHVQTLAFTTDLGKNWQPWMVYRELYSNAIDEAGGVVMVSPRGPSAVPHYAEPHTRISVEWAELDDVHTHRGRYFIPKDAKPLASPGAGLEIYNRATEFIFYKGMAAGKLPKPATFTYNLTGDETLTEDRTIPSYVSTVRLGENLPHLQDSGLLEAILSAPESQFESTFDFDYCYTPSPKFIQTVVQMHKAGAKKLPVSAVRLAKSHSAKDFTPTTMTLPASLEDILAWAKAKIEPIAGPVHAPILVSNDLGANILGKYMNKTIYLSLDCFNQGRVRVLGTLLEEHLHASQGLDDCSRSMQNWLVDAVAALASGEWPKARINGALAAPHELPCPF